MKLDAFQLAMLAFQAVTAFGVGTLVALAFKFGAWKGAVDADRKANVKDHQRFNFHIDKRGAG